MTHRNLWWLEGASEHWHWCKLWPRSGYEHAFLSVHYAAPGPNKTTSRQRSVMELSKPWE
jgi:hypothetical protein